MVQNIAKGKPEDVRVSMQSSVVPIQNSELSADNNKLVYLGLLHLNGARGPGARGWRPEAQGRSRGGVWVGIGVGVLFLIYFFFFISFFSFFESKF